MPVVRDLFDELATETACALIPSAIAAESCRRGDVVAADVDPVPMRSTYWLAVSDSRVMERPAVLEFLTWLRDQHAKFGAGP